MPRVAPFEAHSQRYEAWFGKHEAAYISELLALRPFVPWEGRVSRRQDSVWAHGLKLGAAVSSAQASWRSERE